MKFTSSLIPISASCFINGSSTLSIISFLLLHLSRPEMICNSNLMTASFASVIARLALSSKDLRSSSVKSSWSTSGAEWNSVSEKKKWKNQFNVDFISNLWLNLPIKWAVIAPPTADPIANPTGPPTTPPTNTAVPQIAAPNRLFRAVSFNFSVPGIFLFVNWLAAASKCWKKIRKKIEWWKSWVKNWNLVNCCCFAI